MLDQGILYELFLVKADGSKRAELVEVSILTGFEKLLVYKVPSALIPCVNIGSLVRVPLLNRREIAIVRRLGSSQEIPEKKIRSIIAVLYPDPVITPDMMKLGEWMKAYYFSSMEAVFEAMIPAPVRKGKKIKMQKFLEVGKSLSVEEQTELETKFPKQAKLYAFLQKQKQSLLRSVVIKELEVSLSVVESLIKKELVVQIHRQRERVAYDEPFARVSAKPFDLNEEQKQSLANIVKSIEQGGYQTHLLHGVTGSGKTEVYLQAIRRVLAEGGGVIFLVPEVALTPQTVEQVRAQLAVPALKTVVWHSHLSEGERFDGWLALATGKAQVVVGARSAIFAPVRNLRLIIVDEEHEPAYKQTETPRYHGRDVAVYRAMICKAVCVLGSATPSLESLYNVQVGKYLLEKLTKRIDERQLPKMHLIDMKYEILKERGLVSISKKLSEYLWDRFEKKEQSILFLNRRGYSKTMLCPDCGHVEMCPHCSVTLTYHRGIEVLRCHVCGYGQTVPYQCPQCQSVKIRWKGFGTQKIEEIIQKLLPHARIARIDSDTMLKKNQFREIFNEFRVGKIDILVGTQMIAKGLDFPNVTLVGLIDADISLHMPDFRASERTFQLLVQVAGRAGRGDKKGDVVVQTFTPQSDPIQFARRADFEGFLLEELEQRKQYQYPPFRHLIRHLFRGRDLEKVLTQAKKWVEVLSPAIGKDLEIRGPAPAPLEKVKDYYRVHVWYFVDRVRPFLRFIEGFREKLKCQEVKDGFDVDPVDLN